jgi:hypothetical protein
MIRKHFRFKRLILGLAVVFAIAAVTAPSVPAMHVDAATGGAQVSSGKYGTLDPWAYNVINQSTQANPGKYGALDPWAYTVIHPSSPAVVTARPGNGFNYSDAGIGAAVSFGAALLLLTAIALGRRSRSRFDGSGLATS